MDEPLRAFLIFDRSCDGDLRNELMRQAKRAELPFAIVAESRDEQLEHSDELLRSKIREADEVVVICGQHTGDSSAVRTEFAIALEEKKPYLLIWGRRGIACTKPVGAKASDGMYMWSLEIIALRTHEIERQLRPRQPRVPRPAAIPQ